MNILKKLYSPKHIIPESERLGELPSARFACRDVFKLAFPAILESLMLQLCGTVDTMMVGSVGTHAISAIGTSGPIRTLIVTFYSALSIANAAVIARRIGSGDKEEASETMRQSLVYTLIISLLVCVPGFIFTPDLLRLCGTPEAIMGDAAAYIRIWLFGVPLWGLSVPINSSFRAAGKPHLPMISNIIANLVNVFFNYLLIGGNFGFPALGVRGAAAATMSCYIVQTSICFYFALRRDSAVHLDLKKKFKFDAEIFTSLKVVFPAQLFSGLVSFTAGTIQTRIINSLGNDDSFAAYQIIMSLYGIFVSVASGFSGASGTLVGQSLGRRRPDISILYTRLCITLAIVFSLFFVIFFTVFDEFVIGLYVPDRIAGKTTFDAALTMLYILIASTPINVMHQVYWGTLQGAGDSRFLTFQTFFSLICRTVLFYVLCLPLGFGIVGTLVAIIVDDTIRVTMSHIRFRRGEWKYIRL
ncbi:MAG: MATE family efflux transporter [Oscillospiraceae bacterium]|nr:MATE family efflux transporter [Oscillospiraceae bacterium]